MFNNVLFSSPEFRPMSPDQKHPSFARLISVAEDAGYRGPTALANALNMSEQVVNNWGRRGVSKSGAMAAQDLFGCSANWVISGVGQAKVSDAPVARAAPSLAELIKRLSHEIQAAEPDTQDLVAVAFAQWSKAPHRWERLVSQLERLNISAGTADKEPRYVVATTADGAPAIAVQPGALHVIQAISLLPESIQADHILDEVYEALLDSKQRNGLTKWPHQDNRHSAQSVVHDRRVNPEGNQPMTTADRFRLIEAAGHVPPPKR